VEKVGTERELDLVYQKYLRQKDALIELESRRSVIPHLKLETQARLEAARARLKRAKHDLENTKIFCPFDARVELVAAYRSQFVTAHFSIATLTDMSAFELSVGIDPRDLRWLAEAIRPHALEEHPHGPQPEVTVRWSLHGQGFTWRGFVTRFERVDEATRTARLVVEVRHVDMVASVDEGSDEPTSTLAIGMHCRAELPVAELAGALLVPRHAVYDNRWVYVFEPDPDAGDGRRGRLGQREVPVLRSLGDAVLVDYADREGTETCELKPGERVVVSPLSKPVVGMQVRLRDEQIASSEALTLGWPQGDRRRPTRVSGAVPHQLGLIRGGG
jgi:multidrug efflux pump subunit AcrA (membrane-fusion protein)